MAERLDSVPDSVYSDDDIQDDYDYYYAEEEDEVRGEEELNELAANTDPEYHEFKCLEDSTDVLKYVDSQVTRIRDQLSSRFVSKSVDSWRPETLRELLCASDWKVDTAVQKCVRTCTCV